MKTIDFAIDLGTTNSLITKYQNGAVKIFKNPRGFRETLPSVVAFRQNGVLIGEKAKELKDRDFKNVFSHFKRKIGTDATYFVENEDRFVKPQELSSLVVKELQSFVIDQKVRSSVITIPASFSTVQSNATKEAAYAAGFEEVVLLQEPIAASLAVFNSPTHNGRTGKWLVFDLGGGTFDVAIVDITENDLKILDHDGNNFLGGLDFDTAIVKEVIIPELAKVPELSAVVQKLLSEEKDKESLQLFELLLIYAEQLKIELSSFEKAFGEVPVQDNDGRTHYVNVELEISRFNKIIEPFIANTIGLVKDLLNRNSLETDKLEELVLVGGSTYVPYLRERLGQEFKVSINQEVDPASAIALGAGYYAGNKESRLAEETVDQTNNGAPQLELVYEKNARDISAMLMVKSSEKDESFTLRIVRSDKGFDTGYLDLKSQQFVSLALLEGVLNEFSVEVYKNNVLLDHKYPLVEIRQGHFSIDGQPIPNDICIEVDDVERGETLLEPLFFKNDILPLKKTIYKTVSKDLLASSDNYVSINILEGDRNASPVTNLVIGQIQISPTELGQNLYKGTDLGITVEITESRDVRLSLNLMSMDREISESFKPNQRSVDERKLHAEVDRLLHDVSKKLQEYLVVEDYVSAAEFQSMEKELQNCQKQLGEKGASEDTLFSVDEQKRKLGARFDRVIRNQIILDDIMELRGQIDHGENIIKSEAVSPSLKKNISDQIKIGRNAMEKSNVKMIRHATKKLEDLIWEYNRDDKEYLIGLYFHYSVLTPLENYQDQRKAQELIEKGDKMRERNTATSTEWMHLISALYYNLKPEFRQDENGPSNFSGTGLE